MNSQLRDVVPVVVGVGGDAGGGREQGARVRASRQHQLLVERVVAHRPHPTPPPDQRLNTHIILLHYVLVPTIIIIIINPLCSTAGFESLLVAVRGTSQYRW